MKMQFFPILLVLLLGCGGATCSGVGDFSVTRDTDEVVVNGSTGALDRLLPVKVLPDMDLDFDLQSELAAQDADGAKSVHLTALSLEITDTSQPSGDDDDFDFLDEIEFRVTSAKEGTTLEPRVIARIDSIPMGARVLDLQTEADVDLKPYAEEGMVLTTRGKGSVPPDDVSIKGVVTVEVQTF